MKSSIEWTGFTWNAVDGCSPTSPGCANCYAARMASRFSGPGEAYEGLAENGRWTGRTLFHPDRLVIPLRRRKPSRFFVNSMGDLFHPRIEFETIAAHFGVMAGARRHTFQILTKWPERAVEFFAWIEIRVRSHASALPERELPFWIAHECFHLAVSYMGKHVTKALEDHTIGTWPLPNVHLGVSVEGPKWAENRIWKLFDCPAAVRFVSYEPALEGVDFGPYLRPAAEWCDIHGHEWDEDPVNGVCLQCGLERDRHYLDWIIVGGESGPKARPFDIEWARRTVRQGQEANTPVFVKQLGRRVYDSTYEFGCFSEYDKRTPRKPDGSGGTMAAGNLVLLRSSKGNDPTEWPEEIRVREFPR